METGEINYAELPWDVDLAMGDVKTAELLCPGVFYISLYVPFETDTEFYILDKSTEAISDKAKAYGHQIEDLPDCLIYPYESEQKGRRIVAYEIQRYYMKCGYPEADSRELRETAAYGMEICPEYFGTSFPPFNTPLGHIVRYETLMSGVFWTETDTANQMIAVAFPCWLDTFSRYTLQYALQTGREQGKIDESIQDFLYFPENAMPLSLFELQRYHREFQHCRYIDSLALMNTLYRDFPDYVVTYNKMEQEGISDTQGLLLNTVGFEVELSGSTDHVIYMTQNTGFRYLHL